MPEAAKASSSARAWAFVRYMTAKSEKRWERPLALVAAAQAGAFMGHPAHAQLDLADDRRCLGTVIRHREQEDGRALFPGRNNLLGDALLIFFDDTFGCA